MNFCKLCYFAAFVFLLPFSTRQIFAGFERNEAGGRTVALGGAYVGMADDSWAIFYNPAGLSQLIAPEASVFYSPQPFEIPELRSLAFVASYPTGFGTLGASLRSFGFELYKETSLGISYAQTVSGLIVGMNVNYHAVSIARYGNGGTLGVDVGVLVPISQTIRWGIVARNIKAPRIGKDGEKLPQIFATGISYKPISSLSLALDYEKEVGFTATPRFGCEYWMIDAVAFRAGVVDEPASLALGLGIRYSFFQVDYGFTTHRELGLTHQASVTLRWLSDGD
jgi:hypothetical protein